MQEKLEAVDTAERAGFYLVGFMLQYATIEANLRASTGLHDAEAVSFFGVITALKESLKPFRGKARLIRDLREFNLFRNRLVHDLWFETYAHANEEARRERRWALGITKRVMSMPTVRELAGVRTTFAELKRSGAWLSYDLRERPRRKILGSLLGEWVYRRRSRVPAWAEELEPQIEKELRRQRLELRYIEFPRFRIGHGDWSRLLLIVLRPVARH
jgi:hypothetical protein